LIAPDAREVVNPPPAKRSPDKAKTEKPAEKERNDVGFVWKHEGDYFTPIRVVLGMTDGVKTEILSGELKEGDVLTIGETKLATGGSTGTSNPFTPQMFKK
jgi:hypothetical protein